MIAGCDGFHGICRPSIPAGVLRRVLARVPVRLARDPRRGRAVERRARLRAPRARVRAPQPPLAELSRLYLQCRPDEDLAEWPDERIWEELQTRLGARRLDARTRARSSRRASRAMRSYVVEPMQLRAASSSPATPRTSCRRPARRGSTSRSTTCACSPRRSSPGTGRRRDAASTPTRTRACGASGAPSTSRGG